jgi:hypothetical protein
LVLFFQSYIYLYSFFLYPAGGSRCGQWCRGQSGRAAPAPPAAAESCQGGNTPEEQPLPSPRESKCCGCSVTANRGPGTSNTCRLPTTSCDSCAEMTRPHTAQRSGKCTCTWSGFSTACKVRPVCPGCPPRGFLSLGKIRFFRYPSLLGGLWLFWLFSPNRRLNSMF